MASVIVSLVSKEKNVNHNFVISDPNVKRVRHGDVEVVFGGYLRKRYLVSIYEAFLPVHEALTKTMRKKVSMWGDNHASKRAFDAFLYVHSKLILLNSICILELNLIYCI
jgi:hypothetical protein